jgi:hypothetical protein
LNAIASGLVDFYEDTGRFPRENEGLRALVSNPGITSWLGPYMGGGVGVLVEQIEKDEFGEAYAYDYEPDVSPSTAADVLVVSSGQDFNFTSGSVGNTWSLNSPGNDLFVVVTAGPVNREKIRDCHSELEAIAEASREYFDSNGSFPNSSTELLGGYLDAGIDGDAFMDPWNIEYVFDSSNSPSSSSSLIIMSLGPNRESDSGDLDDWTSPGSIDTS